MNIFTLGEGKPCSRVSPVLSFNGHGELEAGLLVAGSRLRDGGGKSFRKKKCEKRAGAGERQGSATAAAVSFPKSCASYFRFARFNTFPLYYLRAWHRLDY